MTTHILSNNIATAVYIRRALFLLVLAIGFFRLNASCISLSGEHYGVKSIQSFHDFPIVRPDLVNACGHTISMHYDDQHFSLTQTHGQLPFYFKWENWNWSFVKSQGDGGVDVTGAPNTLLVEGTSQALDHVDSFSALRLSIAIPADGYLMLDLSQIGGSNLISAIQVNGKNLNVGRADLLTPLLKAGDLLTIKVDHHHEHFNALISTNVDFYSNAIGVVKRTWHATDGQGHFDKFSQFIHWQSVSVLNIVLPTRLSATVSPENFSGATVSPEILGYPLIDEDGDFSTTYDQTFVHELGEGIEYAWSDELIRDHESGTCKILRTWSFLDPLRENQRTVQQQIDLDFTSTINEVKMVSPYGVGVNITNQGQRVIELTD